jgi:hypothetical protein
MEILWLGQCFGYFFQNLGTFFLNLLVTLHVRHLKSSLTIYQRDKILNIISKPLACSIRIRTNIAFSKMFCKQNVLQTNCFYFAFQKPKTKTEDFEYFFVQNFFEKSWCLFNKFQWKTKMIPIKETFFELFFIFLNNIDKNSCCHSKEPLTSIIL